MAAAVRSLRRIEKEKSERLLLGGTPVKTRHERVRNHQKGRDVRTLNALMTTAAARTRKQLADEATRARWEASCQPLLPAVLSEQPSIPRPPPPRSLARRTLT